MASPFEKGNNAVILESSLYTELALDTADLVPTELPTAAPSSGTDGVALNGAARLLIACEGGVAATLTVYFYLTGPASSPANVWALANGVSLTVTATDGITERLNCAGYERVYIRSSDAGVGRCLVYRSIT